MPLLTPKEAAAELGITARQLHGLAADGAIAFIDIGRGKTVTRRFDPADLEAFKAARRTVEGGSSKVVTLRRGPPPRTAAPTLVERVYPRRPKPGPPANKPLPGYKPKPK